MLAALGSLLARLIVFEMRLRESDKSEFARKAIVPVFLLAALCLYTGLQVWMIVAQQPHLWMPLLVVVVPTAALLLVEIWKSGTPRIVDLALLSLLAWIVFQAIWVSESLDQVWVPVLVFVPVSYLAMRERGVFENPRVRNVLDLPVKIIALVVRHLIVDRDQQPGRLRSFWQARGRGLLVIAGLYAAGHMAYWPNWLGETHPWLQSNWLFGLVIGWPVVWFLRHGIIRLVSWILGLSRDPEGRILWTSWRPYWLASIAGSAYLATFRPWGVVAAIFIFVTTVWIYLALHKGKYFGTGYEDGDVADLTEELDGRTGKAAWRLFWIALPVFGLQDLIGLRSIFEDRKLLYWLATLLLLAVGISPIIWISSAPVAWWFELADECLLSYQGFWLAGLYTLPYWLYWTAVKWRGHGILINSQGRVVIVVPHVGWFPDVRVASAKIKEIVSAEGAPNKWFYLEWDPGFVFPGGEKVKGRFIKGEAVRAVKARM